MKILTISNYYPSHPGGIEIVAQNLVSRWRGQHQVRWAACEVASHPFQHQADDLPLPASNFAEERLGFPYPIPSAKSIREIFRHVRWCEIVHVHDCLYFANMAAFMASRLFSRPLIITQHVGLVPYPQPYKNALQRVAYRTIGSPILKRADEVIFINDAVKNWFESEYGSINGFTIQNGVDHKIFFPADAGERRSIRARLGLPENGIVLLFIGRFVSKKGVDLIREIAAARPAYLWLMVGGGDIDPSGWRAPNVRIFPRQPQNLLRDYYIAADLLVLPSRGEGFPLAVQEALSCGVPAAVSAETASSLPDAPLISLEINEMPGLLSTLDRALENTNSLRSLGDRSRSYAEMWDWDVVAHRYEEHFAGLVSGHLHPEG
jgi:glycosyltransferase involved in cell wall biosynthesis